MIRLGHGPLAEQRGLWARLARSETGPDGRHRVEHEVGMTVARTVYDELAWR